MKLLQNWKSRHTKAAITSTFIAIIRYFLINRLFKMQTIKKSDSVTSPKRTYFCLYLLRYIYIYHLQFHQSEHSKNSCSLYTHVTLIFETQKRLLPNFLCIAYIGGLLLVMEITLLATRRSNSKLTKGNSMYFKTHDSTCDRNLIVPLAEINEIYMCMKWHVNSQNINTALVIGINVKRFL